MIIKASARPGGLKKGVSTKRVHAAWGFPNEVGIAEAVGRLDLSAMGPKDAYLLLSIYNFLVDGGTLKLSENRDGYVVDYKSSKQMAETGRGAA